MWLRRWQVMRASKNVCQYQSCMVVAAALVGRYAGRAAAARAGRQASGASDRRILEE